MQDRRYMAEILPERRKTLSNQSINKIQELLVNNNNPMAFFDNAVNITLIER